MITAYELIPASKDDQSWLERLRRAVYRDLFFATWGRWDEARHQRHCNECWERGSIFVISVDGRPVGMIQLLEGPQSIEVGEIQILPDLQNRGLGSQVLKDVITQAREKRKSVSLSVGLKNDRALRLYERLGFQKVRQTDTHNILILK